MRLRSIFLQCILAGLTVTSAVAKMPRAEILDPNNQPVWFDPNYMVTQLASHVDPDFPGDPRWRGLRMMLQFDVVIGKDGRVKQIVALGSDEPFTTFAKKALIRWTWKPQMWEGAPAVVKTRVGVWFNCGTPALGSAQSIVDTDSPSAVSIVLNSGSTIHADTVRKDANTVSYTIDEQVHQIPNSVIKQIISKDGAGAVSSNVVISRDAAKSIAAGHVGAFSSLPELRKECESHSYEGGEHPELARTGDVCRVLHTNMCSFYEEEVDHAVELEKTLCAAGVGLVSTQARPTDPRLAGVWDGYQKTYADLRRYRTSLAGQASVAKGQAVGGEPRAREMARVNLDIARLSVVCNSSR